MIISNKRKIRHALTWVFQPRLRFPWLNKWDQAIYNKQGNKLIILNMRKLSYTLIILISLINYLLIKVKPLILFRLF
jgi:hypothetical protein